MRSAPPGIVQGERKGVARVLGPPRMAFLGRRAASEVARASETPATPTLERDHILFFTYMLGHSAVICLGGMVQRTLWQAVQHQLMASAYEQRASRAAAEMVRLVEELPSLNYHKVHPFLPNPLASAILFLNTQNNPAEDG